MLPRRRRTSVGQELLDVPMGDMIRDMAFAIAEAQIKLDENSINVAEMMGGIRTTVTETPEGEEHVEVHDSRVFFGRETVTKAEAVAILNSNADPKTIQSVKGELESGDYTGGGEDPYVVKEGVANQTITIPRRMSMMELGFTPTFYQFVDTIIEVKMSIKFTQEVERGRTTSDRSRDSSMEGKASFSFRRGLSAGGSRKVNTSQVNASYSQKYSYSAEGSSLLRTKLVPIPPPSVLEERIQRMMDNEFSDNEENN